MKEWLPSLWITSLLQEYVLHIHSKSKELDDTVISSHLSAAGNSCKKNKINDNFKQQYFTMIMTHEVVA